jgi:glycosyltransferase involved in cell wall biosynthesis
MVAVLMITYKQQEFIAQAIEGVLTQKTNFPFKLFIGDDASPDETPQVVELCRNKFPDKVAYVRNAKNMGMMPNFIQLYSKASAKYIAMCEGDDYWTDPYKLQKQVDFLEANLEYAICFHAINILENGIERPSDLNKSDKEETYSILDLAKENLIHTPSVVFRNGLIEQFPDWFSESPVGDYVLHLLNAKKGLIKYLPEVMAVYRSHAGGTWAQKTVGELYPKWLRLLDKLLQEDFEPTVKEQLLRQKKEKLNTYIEWLLAQKQYELIKPSLETFSTIAETDHSFITDLFLERIRSLEHHIEALKTTGSYKLARRLSSLKSAFRTRHQRSQ